MNFENIIIMFLVITILYLLCSNTNEYLAKAKAPAKAIAMPVDPKTLLANNWYCAVASKSEKSANNNWIKYPNSCLYTKPNWACAPIVKKKDGIYYSNDSKCTKEVVSNLTPTATCGPSGATAPIDCYLEEDNISTTSSSSTKSLASITPSSAGSASLTKVLAATLVPLATKQNSTVTSVPKKKNK